MAESSRDSSAVEGSPALGPVAILHIRCHGNASSLSSLPSLLPLPYFETDNLLSLRSMHVFFNLERMSLSHQKVSTSLINFSETETLEDKIIF